MRRRTADGLILEEYDHRAYGEARASGGVLRYCKGPANERCGCLPVWLWENRRHAAAARKPDHGEAARISEEMCESCDLERYWSASPTRAKS